LQPISQQRARLTFSGGTKKKHWEEGNKNQTVGVAKMGVQGRIQTGNFGRKTTGLKRW